MAVPSLIQSCCRQEGWVHAQEMWQWHPKGMDRHSHTFTPRVVLLVQAGKSPPVHLATLAGSGELCCLKMG